MRLCLIWLCGKISRECCNYEALKHAIVKGVHQRNVLLQPTLLVCDRMRDFIDGSAVSGHEMTWQIISLLILSQK